MLADQEQGNILVVDADPVLRLLVNACFMGSTYTIKEAEHGKEALFN